MDYAHSHYFLNLSPLSVCAQRPFYRPGAIERDHQTFVINADCTNIQSVENFSRIRIPLGPGSEKTRVCLVSQVRLCKHVPVSETKKSDRVDVDLIGDYLVS